MATIHSTKFSHLCQKCEELNVAFIKYKQIFFGWTNSFYWRSPRAKIRIEVALLANVSGGGFATLAPLRKIKCPRDPDLLAANAFCGEIFRERSSSSGTHVVRTSPRLWIFALRRNGLYMFIRFTFAVKTHHGIKGKAIDYILQMISTIGFELHGEETF